jgi:homoserine O-acetyltransferase/O-succinyltransferase
MSMDRERIELTGHVWAHDGPLALSCGGELNRFQLAYQTWGTLTDAKDNAVLVCPALNASHLVAGSDTPGCGYAGWWSKMVGAGCPIDTEKFYVVSVSNLGSCFGSTGPRSIDAATGLPYGNTFPIVTVSDWVRSQALLADHLKIKSFAAVVGGSLGGMQALEWALAFPHRVKRTVAIAATSRLNAQNIAFNEIARQAILCDPDFEAGRYDDERSPRRGLQVARMLGHVTYTSAASLERKFGRSRCARDKQFGSGDGFTVESYLAHQGERFARYFDAHSYLRITRALDYFDLARDHGDGCLTAAMAKATSEFLLIAFEDDWRFSPACSREIEQALRANSKAVSCHEIGGCYGHDGFLLDDPHYLQLMRNFFSSIELLSARRASADDALAVAVE